MNKQNENELKKYWGKIASEYADADEKGYGAVCCPGLPEYFNDYYDFIQKRQYIKLLDRCYEKSQNYQKNALDYGCGVGRWCKVLLERGFIVTGVDITEGMIEKAKSNLSNIGLLHDIRFQLLDGVYKLPDNHYQFSSSIAVIQHNPYHVQKNIISNICNATCEDGYILILEFTKKSWTGSTKMFPNSEKEWIKLFEDNGCQLIATGGAGYNYIYRLLFSIFKLIIGKKKRDLYTTPLNFDENTGSFFQKLLLKYILKEVIFLTYPLEVICSAILPSSWAEHSAILFKKKKI